MAILWSGAMGGRTVEVRSAGATRRLLADGVLHTVWNPRHALTGAVWDPLGLAALLAPSGRTRDALLLGVGGGAAIHLLRRHVRPDRIVAVEREGVLLDLARRFFGVEGSDLDLVEDDAVVWVRRNRARRFDVVIDDLFHEDAGEPVRSASGRAWWRRVGAMVRPGGVLAVNFAEQRTLDRAGLADDPWIRRRFPSAFVFRCAGYTNRIAAFVRGAADVEAFRARLRATPGLRGAAALGRLRFSVRPLASPIG